jgi:hypothetical protein
MEARVIIFFFTINWNFVFALKILRSFRQSGLSSPFHLTFNEPAREARLSLDGIEFESYINFFDFSSLVKTPQPKKAKSRADKEEMCESKNRVSLIFQLSVDF